MRAQKERRRAIEKWLLSDNKKCAHKRGTKSYALQDHYFKVPDGNEKYVIGQQRHLYQKMADNLVELCLNLSILWKVYSVSDKIRYLAEEICKQYV